MRWIVFVAGMLGALGVALGAHAAHGLEASLTAQGLAAEEVAQRLEQCDVAVRYHMLHTLALLSLGLLPSPRAAGRKTAAALLFLLGIALFSGGLYSMVYLGRQGHWAIVPSGGLCFILGWLCLASLAAGRDEQAAASDLVG
ncbi:MAG: DUF423 domain-containing protein [Planctomycetales bacterium]|nr:DUF423 domain-containing protein [Planctomycetales bacterium]